MRSLHNTIVPVLSAVCLAACGQSVSAERIAMAPPANLAMAEQIRLFSLSDARTIGTLIAMSNTTTTAGGDTCVTRTMEGSTVVLTGNGCMNGPTRYDGVLRFTGDPLAATGSTAEYQRWGQTSTVTCTGSSQTLSVSTVTRGTVRVTARGNVREFDVDVVLESGTANREACTTTSSTLAIQYHGTLDFFGPSGVTRDGNAAIRASGSGVVADSRFGRVDTNTTGLVFDPTICAGEPASGTLTLRAGAHTGVVTYDGATNCGMGGTRTAPFTLDGTPSGEVQVNACSVGSAAGNAKSGALALLAIGAALTVSSARRRRAR